MKYSYHVNLFILACEDNLLKRCAANAISKLI